MALIILSLALQGVSVLSSPGKNCCGYGDGLLWKESMRGAFDNYSCHAVAELVAQLTPIWLRDERVIVADDLKQWNIATTPAFANAGLPGSRVLHPKRCRKPATKPAGLILIGSEEAFAQGSEPCVFGCGQAPAMNGSLPISSGTLEASAAASTTARTR